MWGDRVKTQAVPDRVVSAWESELRWWSCEEPPHIKGGSCSGFGLHALQGSSYLKFLFFKPFKMTLTRYRTLLFTKQIIE